MPELTTPRETHQGRPVNPFQIIPLIRHRGLITPKKDESSTTGPPNMLHNRSIEDRFRLPARRVPIRPTLRNWDGVTVAICPSLCSQSLKLGRRMESPVPTATAHQRVNPRSAPRPMIGGRMRHRSRTRSNEQAGCLALSPRALTLIIPSVPNAPRCWWTGCSNDWLMQPKSGMHTSHSCET